MPKPLINIHCHLFNFQFIPNEVSKLLSHIPENIADDKVLHAAAGILLGLIPGKQLSRVREYLNTFRQPINKVADLYIDSMDDADIDICTPLMMDLDPKGIYSGSDDIPYYHKNKKNQIDLISEQAARYPWRILPFVMFNPRRKDSDTICIDALENKGFIGVKMYPALGYYPSYQPPKGMDSAAAERLKNMLEYCGNNRIPITTHTSVGGAYTFKVAKKNLRFPWMSETEYSWRFTEVSNWIDLIREHQLKINFAHLGGDYMDDDGNKRAQSYSWRRAILNLIALSGKRNDMGQVYSDLSFHDMALRKKSVRSKYFDDLHTLMEDEHASRRLMFGTDASMISHSWTEKQYTNAFVKNLKPKHHKRFFQQNAIEFLFENSQIPASYIKFLKNNADQQKAFANKPSWIEDKNGKYFIKS